MFVTRPTERLSAACLDRLQRLLYGDADALQDTET